MQSHHDRSFRMVPNWSFIFPHTNLLDSCVVHSVFYNTIALPTIWLYISWRDHLVLCFYRKPNMRFLGKRKHPMCAKGMRMALHFKQSVTKENAKHIKFKVKQQHVNSKPKSDITVRHNCTLVTVFTTTGIFECDQVEYRIECGAHWQRLHKFNWLCVTSVIRILNRKVRIEKKQSSIVGERGCQEAAEIS